IPCPILPASPTLSLPIRHVNTRPPPHRQSILVVPFGPRTLLLTLAHGVHDGRARNSPKHGAHKRLVGYLTPTGIPHEQRVGEAAHDAGNQRATFRHGRGHSGCGASPLAFGSDDG